MIAVRLEHLCKKYKEVTAVRDLSLSIEEGETFGLLGVNGAGKSTTIKMISCLADPTSGSAELLGHNISTEAEKIKPYLNVSPQETAIAPNLTVLENIRFMAGLYGVKNACIKTDEMLLKLGLEEMKDRRAGKLSGGYQRRLSIAMALISEPKLLYLDEPTLGLDVLARHELWSLIEALKGSVTMILTTHYLEEAESLCDRIGIMAHGDLIAVGTAEELIDRAGAKSFEDAFVKFVGKESR